jgi:putative ABC transport system substrate-binding protein
LSPTGGNLTGFIANLPDMATKRFQIIKELMPSARRAAVLWNPTDSYTKVELNIAKEFAAANDIDILLHNARDIEELRSALASIPQSTPDILIVLSDPFMFTHRKIVADAVSKLRLPAVYGYREYVDDGGMISYGASITDTYRRAAGYVDRILNGAKPGDLPIQLPIKFELVVNLKTAKMIGFALPDSFLLRADEVIE